jgi:hypothetical protein
MRATQLATRGTRVAQRRHGDRRVSTETPTFPLVIESDRRQSDRRERERRADPSWRDVTPS